ncbi:hypothetical protein KBC31_04890 [Candidatus Saccharibacteria bacterium]|jgi:hypothetical protein|nr:hypothetical protein [Candidatus Saccharibacteria bacterium]
MDPRENPANSQIQPLVANVATQPYQQSQSMAAPTPQQSFQSQPLASPAVVQTFQASPAVPAPQNQINAQPLTNMQSEQTVDGLQSQPSGLVVPSVADDVDVIEKEWVDVAKQLVEQTRADPYIQQREFQKLQQDYLMKRYGKQIALSD